MSLSNHAAGSKERGKKKKEGLIPLLNTSSRVIRPPCQRRTEEDFALLTPHTPAALRECVSERGSA